MMDGNAFISVFNKVWQGIINFLPGSPFKALIQTFQNIPYLAYLNWFVPVTEMVAVLEAWLAVVAVFYCYRALMRFINLL